MAEPLTPDEVAELRAKYEKARSLLRHARPDAASRRIDDVLRVLATIDQVATERDALWDLLENTPCVVEEHEPTPNPEDDRFNPRLDEGDVGIDDQWTVTVTINVNDAVAQGDEAELAYEQILKAFQSTAWGLRGVRVDVGPLTALSSKRTHMRERREED